MASRLRIASASVAALPIAFGVWLAASLASSPDKPDPNRAVAVRAADQMLAQIVLAGHPAQVQAAPKTSFELNQQPDIRVLRVSQVDLPRFWTTEASPQAAVASVTAHLPIGAKLVEPVSDNSELEAQYAFATIDPKLLGVRQLVIQAARTRAGTVVRADAQVSYIVARPQGQRIPADVRIIDITVGSNLARPLLSLTVTKASDVRRIAQIVDDLPVMGNGQGLAYSCAALPKTAPTDRFIFRRATDGPALAGFTELASESSEDDGPCLSPAFNIRGHREPAPQDGGILLTQAVMLLHARLAH